MNAVSKLAVWPLLFIIGYGDKVAADDAYDYKPERALFHYQLFCQGCHLPDGRGAKEVPDLTESLNKLIASKEGKQFIIQVPGVASAPLNDAELAELLNWMLVAFASQNTNSDALFTADEIHSVRAIPLIDLSEKRQKLLVNINK
ncbi:cytochrome c [Shewanella corallii]|uniref:Cytochrome c n=1 Tax=Shewanella corallii TaxID=560080 RepID=A0ABT0N523_9GAMM|nr:cytochrome c [Shewanella corallii]MCL2913265.1 cytochrome c [Shewanella corallii]